MGEIVEALKRNKFLNKATTPEERARRVKFLSAIILDLNDATLERLAGTGKKRRHAETARRQVTTAAMYHLSWVMYRLYGERK